MFKKTRFVIALVLVMMLVLTPVTAFANGGSQTGAGSTPTVTWVDERTDAISLATSVNFNFIIDPNGIHGMEDEEINALVPNPDPAINLLGRMVGGDWTALPTAGQIVFVEDGAGGSFINESSYPVTAELSLGLTIQPAGDGHALDGQTITPVTTISAVTGSTNANVFIGATFSDDNVRAPISPANFESDFFGDVTLPITGTAQSAGLVLPSGQFTDTVVASGGAVTVTRNATFVDGSGNGTQIALAGESNPAADWSILLGAGAATISLSLVTTVREATEWDLGATPVAVGDSQPFGLVHVAEGLEAATQPAIGLPHTSFVVRAIGSPRTPDQQAAFEATGTANTARDAANSAFTTLETAHSTFTQISGTPTTGEEETLQEAIDDADDALGTAQAALSAAQGALADAVRDLGDDDINRTNLATAVTQLQGAVTNLLNKIADAKALLGPSATASFEGPVLTINADGFEFPTGTYTVQIVDTRSNNLTAVTSAVVNRVSATQVTITLTAAWAPGGTAQQADIATSLVLTNGEYVVTVYRDNAGLPGVDRVTVNVPS